MRLGGDAEVILLGLGIEGERHLAEIGQGKPASRTVLGFASREELVTERTRNEIAHGRYRENSARPGRVGGDTCQCTKKTITLLRQVFAIPDLDRPFWRIPTLRMRRGRREMDSEGEMPRGGRPTGSAETRIRLFGQMFEWPYGYFDDRSGSEKLTQ